MDDFIRYVPLMVVAVVAANVAIFWHRASRLSTLMPEKTVGYRRIVRAFSFYFGGLTIAWSVGAFFGGFHVVGMPPPSSVMARREPTALDWVFLLAWVLVATRFSFWLFARDGANVLVNHRDIFNSFPSRPGTVKILWTLLLLASLASAVHSFSI